MIDNNFKQAIRTISQILSEQHLSYALIGSSNLALQGMDVSPRDLDLVMRLDDLIKVPDLFRRYLPSNVEKLKPDSQDSAWTAKLEKHPAWNVHFNLGKVPVQVLGEMDDGNYTSKLIAKRLVYILLDGIKIPCFNLEAEAEAYSETSRPQKAERIRTFLHARTRS